MFLVSFIHQQPKQGYMQFSGKALWPGRHSNTVCWNLSNFREPGRCDVISILFMLKAGKAWPSMNDHPNRDRDNHNTTFRTFN